MTQFVLCIARCDTCRVHSPGVEQTYSQERHIALTWLARLRWLAVAGQLTASGAAYLLLDLPLPLAWIAVVIAVTALSNLLIEIIRRREIPEGVVPAVLILDVGLLTALLYCTGGTQNPFAMLYVVHVAMAVVVLGDAWAWVIGALSVASYGLIHWVNRPLGHPLPPRVLDFGNWFALLLVTGLIVYFIGRVMRSLRRRERELIEMRERAGRTAHLASLTTLAGGAAHELGTPLGTIALVAKELELAATRQGADEDLIEDTRLIRQEVDRCRAILDRMRVDVVGDITQTTSAAPAQELFDDLRGELKPHEQARLKIEFTDARDTVIANYRVVRRALSVMLRNAFDASVTETPVTLRFARENGKMVFQITDQGHGMDADVLKRAGEPFFTTKPVGKGMGLGLFLVRLVADNFGGSFHLQSKPGWGTISTLELPEEDRIMDNYVRISNQSGDENSRGG